MKQCSYLRPDMLILDDFGLKPIQPPRPEDLYDVINERYERGSILLTSNRTPTPMNGLTCFSIRSWPPQVSTTCLTVLR